MTGRHQTPLARPRSPLGIVHLLGWTAGVAVVLALYRVALDWIDVRQEYREETQWWQLGYGLVYGTAISTIGLLFWRRFRGGEPFPVHPGHWLLVLGGIAFAIDGVAFGIAKGIVWGWESHFGWRPSWFHIQQSLAWGLAIVVAAAFELRLKTTWNWQLLAAVITGMIAVNWGTHTFIVADLVAQAVGSWLFTGAWPEYLAVWSSLIANALCLLSMPLVLAYDRQPRDWLHWVGVTAAVVLSLVDQASQIVKLIRWS